MDKEIESSVFDELHALKTRTEELERQMATLMTIVQGHANALRIILTAAKVECDKGGDHGPDGISEVLGG
jgi:hypothetical protein